MQLRKHSCEPWYGFMLFLDAQINENGHYMAN